MFRAVNCLHSSRGVTGTLMRNYLHILTSYKCTLRGSRAQIVAWHLEKTTQTENILHVRVHICITKMVYFCWPLYVVFVYFCLLLLNCLGILLYFVVLLFFLLISSTWKLVVNWGRPKPQVYTRGGDFRLLYQVRATRYTPMGEIKYTFGQCYRCSMNNL